MIAIINYGVGNLMSVSRMCEKVGFKPQIIARPQELAAGSFKKIILPGVGAFDHGMEHLQRGEWIAPLNEAVLERKTSILGICLGMQIMCKSSEEGKQPGLGWIDAQVKRFTDAPNLKVPHMGWNQAIPATQNPLITQSPPQRYYFVHSYFVECARPENALAKTTYGREFVSAFRRENVFGVQFHPEKSHTFGMALMKNFLEL